MSSAMTHWDHLIRPYKMSFEREETENCKATMIVEPLEHGYGVTMGNALRRILLSSIIGSAVVSVRIKGVVLEFSHLPGVVEDVPDILLNMKALHLRLTNNVPLRPVNNVTSGFQPTQGRTGDLSDANMRKNQEEKNIQHIMISGDNSFTEPQPIESNLLTPYQLTPAQKFSISVKGPRVVTAQDIQGHGLLEVLDPHQVICTLGEGVTFEADLFVAMGFGYAPAPTNTSYNKTLGEMFLDARFSPIKKVAYHVKPSRIGQNSTYEQLVLEVETNGSISPKDAIHQGAAILQQQCKYFMAFNVPLDTGHPLSSTGNDTSEMSKTLRMFVKDLDLPVRCLNCLQSINIIYVGDLVRKKESDLLRTPNFGRKSLDDIYKVLGRLGLTLGMDIPDWTSPSDIGDNYRHHPKDMAMSPTFSPYSASIFPKDWNHQ